VARGDIEPSTVDGCLEGLIAALGPMPAGDRQAIWWSRRSNLQNFLHALAYLGDGEQSPKFAAMSASVRAAVHELP